MYTKADTSSQIKASSESSWKSGNTLASDASGPSSTPSQGTLADDTSLGFHPFRVGKLSTSFDWEGGGEYSGAAMVLIDQRS